MATPANNFFDKLIGTWTNKPHGEWDDSLGWNFLSQPKLGHAGPRDFMMHHDRMRETITFKKLGIARNIGVDGEPGFWDGLAYTIAITTPTGDAIHQEMGHFLLQVKDQATGDTHAPREANIIRQATIPRANAMLTPGVLKIGSVLGAPDIYSARPLTSDTTLQATIDAELAKHQALIGSHGPDLLRPLDWLKLQFPNVAPGTQDWVFDFHEDTDSDSMASGERVGNPVRVGPLLSAFWIGARVIDGKRREILQYAQKVDIRFNGMRWPHIAVNTLFRDQNASDPASV